MAREELKLVVRDMLEIAKQELGMDAVITTELQKIYKSL